MQQRVVVIGGGYGGVALAKELDDHAEVVLVEPKDAFVHAVAALRVVVDPTWHERAFFPYDRVLEHGRVVQDWARLVSPGLVQLSASQSLEADHIVLATGTGYPFPAKFLEDQAFVATARLARLRAALAICERVLLVGAGPVGIELAGELTSAFPGLGVTLVDREPDILTQGDYLPELRDLVRGQLVDRGVVLELGAGLGYLPPVDVGVHEPFTVETAAGTTIEAQMWFRCYGARPMTGYLDATLSAGMHDDGSIPVTAHLNVVGQDRVWAIGDITDVRESKRATAARDHAGVVAQNIRDVIEGREPSATYAAARERIVLPIGPDGGASQIEQEDGSRIVLGPEETSRMKGVDLFSGSMAELFGRPGVR
ncbi:FAD-dependent oxidoreductase [Cellulomonas sp. KRMCY2]|uniref:FAD-dependent oxidoreductase n=1 Tax=Cellulomonas sp. KRMCY2 TaxID=1304865 RepID=UPI00045E9DAD|nr:FAD-dependent oxidoreductase [Cellulomonas sp. KRMCY2]